MNRRGLVSITVPCHNSASSLAWALASVAAQTYEYWECIVVDDGSADRPGDIVDAFRDARFRLIRLEMNSGRAIARQTALDAAGGDYLAKLDADDWLYPTKLERQVKAMEQEPQVALVGVGSAIEDEHAQLVGVRARGPSAQCILEGPLTRLLSPPVSRAASMVRMPIAKKYQYNRKLLRSEDTDYLLKVLLENQYCVLNDVLYAYREYRSVQRSDVLEAYRCRMRMFWSFRSRYPVAAIMRTAETALKWAVYRTAFAVGKAEALVSRRSSPPTVEDQRLFSQARACVEAKYAEYFRSQTIAGAGVWVDK